MALCDLPRELRDTRRGLGAQPNFARRGFTLIELMVVVVIIAILATLAVPSVVERLRERRSQEAAERIASLYRTARMRAMGRGAAVSVRYQTTTGFTLREAVNDLAGDGSCLMPSSSCANLSATSGTQSRTVATFNPAAGGLYEGVTVTPGTGAHEGEGEGDEGDDLEVCFTPLGSARQRNAQGIFAGLDGVMSFDVARSKGLTRTVLLLPNGVARVVAKAAK